MLTAGWCAGQFVLGRVTVEGLIELVLMRE